MRAARGFAQARVGCSGVYQWPMRAREGSGVSYSAGGKGGGVLEGRGCAQTRIGLLCGWVPGAMRAWEGGCAGYAQACDLLRLEEKFHPETWGRPNVGVIVQI